MDYDCSVFADYCCFQLHFYFLAFLKKIQMFGIVVNSPFAAPSFHLTNTNIFVFAKPVESKDKS